MRKLKVSKQIGSEASMTKVSKNQEYQTYP